MDIFSQGYKDYLGGLKPGDEITYVLRYGHEAFIHTCSVVRRTTMRIVCNHGTFSAKTGKRHGTYGEYLPLMATTEEIEKAKVDRARFLLIRKLWTRKWIEEPTELLEAVDKLINDFNERGKSHDLS